MQSNSFQSSAYYVALYFTVRTYVPRVSLRCTGRLSHPEHTGLAPYLWQEEEEEKGEVKGEEEEEEVEEGEEEEGRMRKRMD